VKAVKYIFSECACKRSITIECEILSMRDRSEISSRL
jgi:hypothetical protein